VDQASRLLFPSQKGNRDGRPTSLQPARVRGIHGIQYPLSALQNPVAEIPSGLVDAFHREP
jgi:hypothetical protein